VQFFVHKLLQLLALAVYGFLLGICAASLGFSLLADSFNRCVANIMIDMCTLDPSFFLLM
jgi:hypothetical protein